MKVFVSLDMGGAVEPLKNGEPVAFDITVLQAAAADKAERYAWKAIEVLMMQHAEWNQ